MEAQSSVGRPIASWSAERDCWQKNDDQETLFSEPSGVFSETWPRSGSMRNGVAYELPMWVPATDGSECSSLLGIPRASEWKGTGPKGSKSQRHSLARGYLYAQIADITG